MKIHLFYLLPFASAVIFALHPVHTEAVVWVSGLPDVSAAFFFLLAFYFYIKTEKNFEVCHLLSALFFLGAILCKEPAVTLSAVFFIYDLSFSKKEGKDSSVSIFFDYLKRYALYAAVIGFYFFLRINPSAVLLPQKATLILHPMSRRLTYSRFLPHT